ncbi:MAG: type IX secretion system membrane protein PorP/SprF [Elusimicrobia bacterium]|nr:type IX secretion system membrane protein PorP/SprF [Elusimicrobiota bacterium]
MKNQLKKISAAAVIFAVLAPSGVRAAYDDVGVSARVTGLGNAYTGVADDAYAIYYNPAGLATLTRPEAALSYSKLLTGLSDNSNLQNTFATYAHPLRQGRWGTYGVAWNYFTLDTLYRESQLYGAYAHSLFAEQYPNQFYGGVTMKILNRTVSPGSVANSPVGPTGIVAVGTPDPALQNTSKTNFDADLGFLWRVKPRWTVGMQIQHALEPNVAFSAGDTDKLGRNWKFGGSYKTPFSTLATDIDFVTAPDGTKDKVLSFGAEKWLPTLVHGSFGFRGSLAVGDRSYRQLATGVSYKIHQLQFDYGFTVPLGGISGTYGTHRLGLTFRFGRAGAAQPVFGESILENIRDLAQVGTPEFRYQMEDLALFKRTAIDEFLRQAKLDVSAGRFADALEKLNDANSLKPGDSKLAASQERLTVVAGFYPQVLNFASDAAQAALYEGILDYLIGKDREALKKLAYAESLNPKDEKIEALAQSVESKTGVVRELPVAPKPAATLGAEKVVGGTMALMEVALGEREYDKVLKLGLEVIQLDPSNALAYKRMGTAYYALKRYPEALKALRTAYKLETDSEERKSLRSYVDALASLIERQNREAAPKQQELPKAPARTPQEIERLYEAGVDLYAQGRLAEAAVMFQKILEIEPSNVSARRALDRVQAEMLQGPKR